MEPSKEKQIEEMAEQWAGENFEHQLTMSAVEEDDAWML